MDKNIKNLKNRKCGRLIFFVFNRKNLRFWKQFSSPGGSIAVRGVWTASDDKLAGILEIGGASAQIAFVPQGNILANKFPVLIGGKRYPLYVHSYLNYGKNKVNDRIKRLLAETSNASEPVTNPCMLSGKPRKHFERSLMFRPVVQTE